MVRQQWGRAALLGLALCTWCCSSSVRSQPARAGGVVRVMTYNLQWFSEDANPKRIDNVRSVLAHIQPDVVALQEIESERALRQVFGNEFELGIIDVPDEHQELALAVRKPFSLVSTELVFSTPSLDEAFPGSRDVLKCLVQTPTGVPMTVYVVHMKSRRGGRLTTDSARESACGLLAAYLATRAKDENAIVLGDFNDAPDDRSLNVLESGDLAARAGDSVRTPSLLVNLADDAAKKDMVSEGLYKLFNGRPIDPVVRGAKADNDRLRGQDYDFPADVRVEQILFDQILVAPRMAKGARLQVYSGEDALRGSPGRTTVNGNEVSYDDKGDLASDHLPVWADLVPRLP
ncbi:MAG: endonuclease/exonuclease/phosphatase family protein [Armatimonadetes bacterium]|nr:endonuclease/exonuclease/phosphatase family protein [Armatimonadota bacterium]